MGFLVMISDIFTKKIRVKSILQNDEIETHFLNDMEWKIIINCGDWNESNENLSDLSANFDKLKTDSQIIITFFALENDIDYLVKGYLETFLGFDSFVSANIKHKKNHIFVNSPLQKDDILKHLAQKDIIQSCEQISLNEKKVMRDSVIMPFNGSRATIKRETLETNRDFFKNLDSRKSSDFPYKARIIFGESLETNVSCAESFDTNPKNTIYKTIGKIFDFNRKHKQITTQSLLDSIIFLNFRIEIECLKILLLQKCTFIVCNEIPVFSVVKFAQKFGITLIVFTDNNFLILTHQIRFQA